MTKHHTTESVERLAKRCWDNTELRATIVFPLHDECAKTLRDLAAERDALRERLDEAANALEAIAEMCWDKRGYDAAKAACDEASDLAGEHTDQLRAFLNGGGNG